MSTPNTPRYRRARDVIARRIAGELVLVPVAQRSADPQHRAAELFVLNDTGAALWEMLAANASATQLAQNLQSRYEVTPDRAAADVEQFIDAMLAIAAIELVEDG